MMLPDNFPDFDKGLNWFLRGKVMNEDANTLTRDFLYDLNSVQITGSISSRCGVSNEMEEILHRWITIANEEPRSGV